MGLTLTVPNAPCGVEIYYVLLGFLLLLTVLFLMHRVELKVKYSNLLDEPVITTSSPPVPNAPCGVESQILKSP